MARRRVAENLVAEGDGVVEISAFGIEIDRLLVIIDGLVGLVQSKIKIADPVKDRDVFFLVRLLRGVPNDLQIDLEGLVELLLLLELCSFLFKLFDVGHL